MFCFFFLLTSSWACADEICAETAHLGLLQLRSSTQSRRDFGYTMIEPSGAGMLEDQCEKLGMEIITTLEECNEAAKALGLSDTIAGNGIDSPRHRPYVCVWNRGKLQLNLNEGARHKGTAAIVVFIPYRLRDLFRKNQVRLVCELEKKFTGQHVMLVAQRRIQDKEKHSNRKASKGQVRPRSRTLTAVHEAILGDVVYPANISAKRIRYLADGNKQIKVELENPYEVSEKLDTFSAVYHALTGKNATFSLPASEDQQ